MIGKIINRFKKTEKQKQFYVALNEFRKLSNNRFSINDEDIKACLHDATATTSFDAHYVYHPAWASRIVKQINPIKHIDISSTLHFCAQLSAFIPVDFYDYRPAPLTLSNLESKRGDLTALPFADKSIESISCMHTIEHIGLGRYGDPIDPEGDLKAVKELKRVVATGGNLLFVVPVGKPRIQFNAHRIYSFEMIEQLFPEFELRNFSLVTDSNDFIWEANTNLVSKQKYGCGCFWFVKK
jgi:SAM-dependent methyltransferase